MSETNRADRYQGRNALRRITTVKRCYHCGWTPTGSGGVAVRHAEVRPGVWAAGFAGVQTCGRIWLCPVCNSKVMARRALEIGAVLAWASTEGHTVLWGSLTARHDARSDLRQLLDIQRAAWREVVQGRSWTRGRSHRVGYVRAAEITIGANGWHPHFHPLILTELAPDAAARWGARLVEDWVTGVKHAGGDAQLEGAQLLKPIQGVQMFETLSGYVTKATYDTAKVALEAVWSQSKTGRGRAQETVSHWTLLAGIAQGLADEADRWLELEAATHGHRMVTWSRGLRDLAGIGDEASDESIAAEEVGTADDNVCFISTNGWAVVRRDPALMAAILETQERGGWGALRALLDATGVDYFTVEPASV